VISVSVRETPEMALPVVGECHSKVPKGGIKLREYTAAQSAPSRRPSCLVSGRNQETILTAIRCNIR
jgi:hypothetical protein